MLINNPEIFPYFTEINNKFVLKYETSDVFSVEIEIEKLTSFAGLDFPAFYRKVDGSLRHYGVEYISRHPKPVTPLKVEITELLTTLQQYESFFSHRSSIHVHANVIHLTTDHLTQIIKFYYLFEPLFFKFLGRRRNKNNFCVPLRQSHPYLNNTFASLTGFTSWQEKFPKYGALSLYRLGNGGSDEPALGTVEWRSCPGTFDTKGTLFPWLDVIEFVHTQCGLIETESLEVLNQHMQNILGMSYSSDELKEEQITLKRIR